MMLGAKGTFDPNIIFMYGKPGRFHIVYNVIKSRHFVRTVHCSYAVTNSN